MKLLLKLKAKFYLSYIHGGHWMLFYNNKHTMLLLFFSIGKEKEITRCRKEGYSKPIQF